MNMSQLLDKLAPVRGLPVLIGVALVILNFVVQGLVYALGPGSQPPGFWLFLFTDGNLLLHLGVVIGLLGVLIGDVL
jgi:hypothetical protein